MAFKPTKITEDAAGYAKLFALPGQAPVVLVTMEATGHYSRNLFAALAAPGYAIALLNPLRTRRFAGEDLERTKTDSIDALGIARFGAQKRPAVTRLATASVSSIAWSTSASPTSAATSRAWTACWRARCWPSTRTRKPSPARRRAAMQSEILVHLLTG